MVVNEYVLEYDGVDESAEARVCSKTAENLLFILDYMNDNKSPVKVIDFGKCPVRTEEISVSRIIRRKKKAKLSTNPINAAITTFFIRLGPSGTVSMPVKS